MFKKFKKLKTLGQNFCNFTKNIKIKGILIFFFGFEYIKIFNEDKDDSDGKQLHITPQNSAF
jgi:hypothetical protein